MSSIASPLQTDRGHTVVVVTPAPPRLGAARRALGVAIAAYVGLLSVLAAVASVPPAHWLRWPGWPEVEWIAGVGAGGIASAVVRALPVGFTLAFGRRRREWLTRRGAIAAAGAALVAAIEGARWFAHVPVRPLLVVVGAVAASLGGLWYERAFAQRRDDHAVRSFTERVVPLELPLTGGVLLLVPAIWLLAQDARRLPLVVFLACFGASLLTSARVSRGPAAGGAWTHAVVAGAWVATATLPVWLVIPPDAALLAAGVALFAAAHALLRPPDATDRRFEEPALRRALPLLAAYLVVEAAWPLTAPFAAVAAPGLTWGWGRAGGRGLLVALAVYAVVGYVLAELRGRREETARAVWRAVAPWAVAGAAALELAHAARVAADASVVRVVVAALAARLGVALYARHRDHVRAWRAMGGRVGGVKPRIGLRDPAARAPGGRRRR